MRSLSSSGLSLSSNDPCTQEPFLFLRRSNTKWRAAATHRICETRRLGCVIPSLLKSVFALIELVSAAAGCLVITPPSRCCVPASKHQIVIFPEE